MCLGFVWISSNEVGVLQESNVNILFSSFPTTLYGSGADLKSLLSKSAGQTDMKTLRRTLLFCIDR